MHVCVPVFVGTHMDTLHYCSLYKSRVFWLSLKFVHGPKVENPYFIVNDNLLNTLKLLRLDFK